MTITQALTLTEPADRVRALHHEQPNEWWEDGDPTTDTFGPTECAHDYRRWPCPTIRALDGTEDDREQGSM